jgi:hypothetical protein
MQNAREQPPLKGARTQLPLCGKPAGFTQSSIQPLYYVKQLTYAKPPTAHIANVSTQARETTDRPNSHRRQFNAPALTHRIARWSF